MIKTERVTGAAAEDPDALLSPESIAKVGSVKMTVLGRSALMLAQAYLYLANQDRSAFAWELDLRPSHEKW